MSQYSRVLRIIADLSELMDEQLDTLKKYNDRDDLVADMVEIECQSTILNITDAHNALAPLARIQSKDRAKIEKTFQDRDAARKLRREAREAKEKAPDPA